MTIANGHITIVRRKSYRVNRWLSRGKQHLRPSWYIQDDSSERVEVVEAGFRGGTGAEVRQASQQPDGRCWFRVPVLADRGTSAARQPQMPRSPTCRRKVAPTTYIPWSTVPGWRCPGARWLARCLCTVASPSTGQAGNRCYPCATVMSDHCRSDRPDQCMVARPGR